jgi:hypothetical protein
MSERVQQAYRWVVGDLYLCNRSNPWCSHFALAMQSGAFIQLIVLFAGVSSRMATLLTESRQCIQGCESACDRLMNVIDVRQSIFQVAIRFSL